MSQSELSEKSASELVVSETSSSSARHISWPAGHQAAARQFPLRLRLHQPPLLRLVVALQTLLRLLRRHGVLVLHLRISLHRVRLVPRLHGERVALVDKIQHSAEAERAAVSVGDNGGRRRQVCHLLRRAAVSEVRSLRRAAEPPRCTRGRPRTRTGRSRAGRACPRSGSPRCTRFRGGGRRGSRCGAAASCRRGRRGEGEREGETCSQWWREWEGEVEAVGLRDGVSARWPRGGVFNAKCTALASARSRFPSARFFPTSAGACEMAKRAGNIGYMACALGFRRLLEMLEKGKDGDTSICAGKHFSAKHTLNNYRSYIA